MTPLRDDHEPGASSRREKTRAIAPGTGGKIMRIVAVIVIGLGVGFLFVHRQKNDAEARLVEATGKEMMEAPAVNVFTITPSPGTQSLKLPGETAAWNETAIYARVNGYVAKWFADIGDNVTAGQTLALIETPELDAELLAAKAKLNSAIAQVAVKQARADFAVTTDQRWRESPKGVVSDQERESKKAGSAEALAELNAAHAQVMLQQADVDRLTALTQFKEVKAPFDGTIVQRQIDLGNLVTAGSTANTTSLYRLSENSPMRIFVYAPQSVAHRLMKAGTGAVITSADIPAMRLEGKVARTARAINPQSRTIRIEIDVPNSDRSLVPGMYVQAEFELTGGAQIQIPAAAMLYRSGGPQVAVVEPSGAVAFRDVTIASDDGNMVSIGTGLAVGEKVALNLSSQIAAGVKVKANSDDAKSASVQKPVQ
ncbi:efflux RND transporter periplasmic adaptor subunit [Bradyrhizobium sp.]|jgi:RND family efflux transporter MFP subunit|uniref:efflux RND transporter periplasmic adaptor subunit n=1 Tax=Bradyrhizobium sp. TaxID=376 RepID=UPI002C65AB5E|nr:efflux RND transporter periplasmic adaptor subunit [Bradyrhizobium sp.]HWX57331.1 efflux RND transporter periplasmic adaptor subunit [Bradyrhizobium sp.]